MLYRRYCKLVMAHLRRRTGDAESAADLMAETFAAALVMVGSKQKLPRDPAAWLFGVANNKYIDSVRRGVSEDRARRALQLGSVTMDDPAADAIDELTDPGALAALLDELPLEQRAAVRARILDEREYAEIALDAGCSEPVARKRVSRGLAALRGRLEDGYERHL